MNDQNSETNKSERHVFWGRNILLTFIIIGMTTTSLRLNIILLPFGEMFIIRYISKFPLTTVPRTRSISSFQSNNRISDLRDLYWYWNEG